MKYITLLAGLALIGTIVYFGLQPAPVEKQPVTEAPEQAVTETTSPEIKPENTPAPKKEPTKTKKTAPEPKIIQLEPPQPVAETVTLPTPPVIVVEQPKETPPEVPEITQKFELEVIKNSFTDKYGDPWVDIKAKGSLTFSNGTSTYLTDCKAFSKVYTQSGVLIADFETNMPSYGDWWRAEKVQDLWSDRTAKLRHFVQCRALKDSQFVTSELFEAI